MSFLVYVIMEYAYICPKKIQIKIFKKKNFPKGGLNPRTLDLKFTALTTRPKELTQEVDENDGTKLYKRFVKNLSFLSQMSLIFKKISKS